MGRVKELTYIGSKQEGLETGKSYTINQLAKVVGCGYRCMQSRLTNKKVVTDNDLYPHQVHKIPNAWANKKNIGISRFESVSEILSNQYLRRAL